MAVQFDRIYDLRVGDPGGQGISITQLQIEFDIKLSDDSDPNTATIKVTNLNEEHRKLLVKDKAVVLRAGYVEGGLATLFTGTISSFNTIQKGADIVTTIIVGDGYTPLRDVELCDTTPKRSTTEKNIRFLAKRMGLPIGSLNNGNLGAGKGLNRVYTRGLALTGTGKKNMDNLTHDNGLIWYIEAGYLIVIPRGGTRLEAEIAIDETKGLLGSPSSATSGLGKKKDADKKQGGIRFQTLLNHQVVVGRRIKLTSKFYNGVRVRATKVNHRGSFRSKNWTTMVDSEVIESLN